MRTRYPIKVKDRLYPAGTPVRQATLEEMKTIWPFIVIKPGSPQYGVWFPEMPWPTILHASQIDVSDRLPTG